jgi:hypothetical protein
MHEQWLDEVIAGVYSAASGRLDWKSPLEKLSEALGLWATQIIGVDKRSGTLMFSAEGGVHPPECALDYIRYWHPHNVRLPHVVATTPDRWMHCHEHIDDAYVAQSSFYQDYLIPYGSRYLTATKIIDNEDMLFMLGIMRGNGSHPISADEMPGLERLKQHMTTAFSNFVHLRSTYAELGVARSVLNHFRFPILLVDQTRGIWYRNDLAEAALQQGDYILERGGGA